MDDSPPSQNTPSLSVVIPSFNQAETIEQTLTSILEHNNLEGLEVLVFDSMSIDGTSGILERWEDRCTIIQEKDKGQSDAINKGFIRAKGDIVCWLNSDDIFFPHALDQVRQKFAKNPSTQIISGQGVHLYQDGGFKILFPENLDFEKSLSKDLQIDILQPTVFFRRDLLEKLGGINPELHYVMDWDLWCRFIKEKAHWLTVDDFFSAARVHPETKTSSGGLPRLFEHWRVARKHTGLWFPKSTRGLFFSWGLEDAPPPLSSLFKLAYNLKSFCRFGNIKPNIHSSQFCEGKIQITFPWYGGKTNSINIGLEFHNINTLPENITLNINDQSFIRKLIGKEKKQALTIDYPLEENVIKVSISTESPVRFRVTKIMPSA
ncbi:glycosyltransferase [bacterium AH-315-C08]|nr:glycosyltransferase [bacterium AH-315-C08]